MNSPQQPLLWPDDYPPTDPVKKFFWGIRWLGPDISFFKLLEAQQAGRTDADLEHWMDSQERRVAIILGECLCRAAGWKTPYFLPSDTAVAAAYGPKFRSTEEFYFEEATRDFEIRVGKRFSKGFWEGAIDWNDKHATIGELVRKVVAECETAPPRGRSGWRQKLRRLFGVARGPRCIRHHARIAPACL